MYRQRGGLTSGHFRNAGPRLDADAVNLDGLVECDIQKELLVAIASKEHGIVLPCALQWRMGSRRIGQRMPRM